MNSFPCQVIVLILCLLGSRQICNANIEDDSNIENTNRYKIITHQQRFTNDKKFHQTKQKYENELTKQRQRQRKLGKRTLKKKNSDTDNNIFNRQVDDNYVYDDDHNDDNSNNADDAIYIGKGKGSYYDDEIHINDGKGKGSGSSKGKGGGSKMGSKKSGKGYDDDNIGKGKGSTKSGKGKGYDDDDIVTGKGKGGDIIGTRAPTRAPPPSTLSLAPATRAPRTLPPTFSPTISPTKRPRKISPVSIPNNVNFTAEGILDNDAGNCQTKLDGNIGTQKDTAPVIANYRYELQTTSDTITSQLVQDWIIPDLEISFSDMLAPYVMNLSECLYKNNAIATTTNAFVTTKTNIHFNQRHIQQLQNIPTSIIPTAALGMSSLPIDTVETTRFCQNSASLQSCYVILGKMTIYVNNTTNERRRRMQLKDDEIIILSKYYSDLVNDIIKQWISSTNNFTNLNPLIQGLYINDEISSNDDDIVAVKDIDLEPFIQTDDSNNTNVIIGILCGAIGGVLLFTTVGYIQRRRVQSSQRKQLLQEETINYPDDTNGMKSIREIVVYPNPHRVLEEDLYYPANNHRKSKTNSILKSNLKYSQNSTSTEGSFVVPYNIQKNTEALI